MSFKILYTCPHCGMGAEASLCAFFGEGITESQRYCVACKKSHILFISFSTSKVDQNLITSPEFLVSGNYANFEKAQPKREHNKRVRMWRTIAAASKQLSTILNTVATEFTACATQANELRSLVKVTREKLKAEGVIGDGTG